MPIGVLSHYQNSLPELIAEYKLILSDPISFPHLTEKGRSWALREWRRQAGHEDEAPKLAPEQHRVRLALMGIGVKRVPRQGVR